MIFVEKSIFRLCLFLDIWSMVQGLQYDILGVLVMLVKIDGHLFFGPIGRSLFLDCLSLKQGSQILFTLNNIWTINFSLLSWSTSVQALEVAHASDRGITLFLGFDGIMHG